LAKCPPRGVQRICRKRTHHRRRWPIINELNGPYLERELGRLTNDLPKAAEIQNILSVSSYDDPNRYDDLSIASGSFRQALEGWQGGASYGGAHNVVHMFVGGSMGPLTSPNDPVFFLHHCNVDRIWYQWQVQKSCYKDCYKPHTGDGTVSASTPAGKLVNGVWRLPGHEWDDRLYPWYLHPRDVADQNNSQKGYIYV